MSSSFPNPTEFFWAMPYSSGQEFHTGDLRINSALLSVLTDDPTLETTVPRVQSPVGSQMPQPLSTYDASPHGTGLEGHITNQRKHWHDRSSRSMKRKVPRAVCTDCNVGFGRAQELARHRKDVHEPRRICLFCGFKWSRPSNIKTHLFARHSEEFTPATLITIRTLRGRMMVAFLDAYNQGTGMEPAFQAFQLTPP